MESSYKVLLIMLMVVIFTPLLSAQAVPNLYFKQNVSANLSIPCVFNDSQCSNTASCNYSIYDPDNIEYRSLTEVIVDSNSSFLIEDIDTTTYGTYRVNMYCEDQGIYGSNTIEYFVNLLGIESTDSRTETLKTSIYFFFVLGVLLFCGFLFLNLSMPYRLTFLIFSLIFLLAGLNVLTVSVADEGVNPRLATFFDTFTAITYVFYWFAAGLLIIMWAFTFLNTWICKINMDRFNNFGGPE